jgi:hypothetical protein
MAKKRIPEVDVPKLASNFSVSQYLTASDKEAQGIRFYGKVLGQTGSSLFCETQEGIYEFKTADVLEYKVLHAKLDYVVVHHSGAYTLHSTIARLVRTSRPAAHVNPLPGIRPDPGIRDVIDTLSFPGSHEWRGASLEQSLGPT